MKTGMFNARHHGVAGPGGWFCTCCGPAPKYRKMVARLHKRRTYRLLNNLEQDKSGS